MKKKVLSLLVSFAMLFSMLPTTALAVESDDAAGSDDVASNSYYEFEDVLDPSGVPMLLATGQEETVTIDLNEGSYTIETEGNYVVSKYTGSNTLTIEAGANVELQGVDITAAEGVSAISIESGDVTLDVTADSTVKGGDGKGHGISVAKGATVTIKGGKLTAYGGNYTEGGHLQTSYGKNDPEGGAGIGGGTKDGAGVGTINIVDATVVAYGGSKAAGIGAMFWNSVEAINISGNSNVTAYGGSSSAGIGTSRAGDGVSSNITISGGTVTAVGGDYGSGIGAGYNADSLGNGADASGLPETSITITGGTVNATGGMGGAAIGGGYKSDNVDIDITGGTITATAGALVEGKTVENGGAPAAIGSGANGSGTFENSPVVEISEKVTSITVTAYEDGKPAVEGMTNEAVDALENVTLTVTANPANQPAGNNFTGYTREDAIWGEVWGNAEESFVIKVLDGEGNVMGTTSLNNIGGIIDGDVNVTWSLKLDAESNTDGYWTMKWTTAPSIDNQPAKVELWVDGVKVSGGGVVLNSPDDLFPVFAAMTDADGDILSYIRRAHNADASTVLKDAISTGDNIAILVAGTYTPVFSGKDITITGAVDGVVFDNIGAYNMGSANVTFNNVTFDYYPNVNYTGLQHSGNLVYNNCTINGQVFLYGTSETFNKCIFNQNSADAYNVWTYGAKKVAFNECTFNSAGKSVLIYSEDANLFNDVTVTDCDFIASAPVEGKAAIEMDSSLTSGIKLTIDAATTATGFGSGNVSGNSLWNNKKGNADAANNDITVVVSGTTVLEPVVLGLSGTGTEADPYLINNLEELTWFRDTVNTYQSDGSNQFKGKYVKLNADIDLDGINWTPIGTNSVGDHMAFMGTFDGGNHTISNLYVNADGGCLGFFARVGSYEEGITPTVKNITFNNVDVSTNVTDHWTTGHGDCVGGVIAEAAGNTVVSNVTVTGDVYVDGCGYVGGIVGHGYPDLTNCHVTANDGSYVHAGYWCAGGIVGHAGEGGTPITKCSVSGLDIWSAYGAAAAVAGLYLEGNTMTDVTASNVEITSNSDYCMGYIAGNGEESTMTGVTMTNVTASANGKDITVTDAVATVGTTTYFNLQEALNAAAAGSGEVTVEILRDVDLTNVDWNPVTVSAPGYPLVTVNGNNKTITGLNDMLFAGTWAGNSGLIINDLTIKDSTIENDVDDAQGTVGVGAFIGYPQASATITLNNCHLVDSTVSGGHWTGGLIGMAGGYNGNDGPVFMNLTITGCSVTGSTITGKGSVGGVIGHGSCAAWTNVVIENTTVSGNTITSTGSSTDKAGSVMGTIGAAGQPTTADGETKTGGASVSATVSDNTVTSGGTTIKTIYGRQGTETGTLEVTGGSYDSYPIEENVSYAAPAEGHVIVKNEDDTYSVKAVYVAEVNGVKFTTLAAAIGAIATDGSDTTIKLLCDAEMNADIAADYGTGKIIFTADTPVTVKQTAVGTDFDFTVANAANIVIEENVTIEVYDNSSGMYLYYGPSLTLNGTVTGGQNWGALYLYQGEHTVSETGKVGTGRVQLGYTDVTVQGEVDTNYLLVEGSTFTADGAKVDAGVIYDNNNGTQRLGASTFDIKNSSEVTAGTLTLSYADSKLTIDMGSTLTATTITGAGQIIIDAEDYVSGDTCPIIGNASTFTGTIQIINNKYVVAEIDKDGNIVLVEKQPAADLTYGGYVGTSGVSGTESYRENIQVDLYNVYAAESLVVELWSGETKLSTTTLRDADRDDENAVITRPITGSITANIVVSGRLAGSWDTEWHVAPNSEDIPDTIKAYADGGLVDTWNGGFTNDEEKTEYIALTGVTKPVHVTGVSLSGTTSVKVGNTVTLTATVAPDNANNKNVTWTSSNEGVATVEDGVVTGVAAGTATITVTTEDGGFTASCTVTVSKASTGGSSGGGGGSTSYTIAVEDAKNGDITVSPSRASKGTTVTITVDPDNGYELDELTVLDKNGDEVKLTKKSDTKYTFTMPSGKVTIEGTFAEIEEVENPFVDVAEGKYYYDAVLWAAENGITGGTTATTFEPATTCTRAQTVTFLWRAAGSPEPESTVMPFTDVVEGSYYYDAVLWAVENGITTGTSATTFEPYATVTRAQNVTFLWRWAESPAAEQANPFTDVAEGKYYHDAVIWAAEQGITSGTTATTFSPNDPCLRSQIVTFLYRYLAD